MWSKHLTRRFRELIRDSGESRELSWVEGWSSSPWWYGATVDPQKPVQVPLLWKAFPDAQVPAFCILLYHIQCFVTDTLLTMV